MARLFEYQAKELLEKEGIKIPEALLCTKESDINDALKKIGNEIVLKAQVWTKERKKKGGILFPKHENEAVKFSKQIFGKKFDNFICEKVLVEKIIPIKQEMFAGIVIDDNKKTPVLIFSPKGGTGIEEIAQKHPESIIKCEIDIIEGLNLEKIGIKDEKIAKVLTSLYSVMRKYEARSVEINPLVVTKDNEVYALDCHMTIDDYAVFRHPELGIEIARELDRPPSALDKIAYNVEKGDYRGTFYFIQLEDGFKKGDGYLGFHGAGGGGSMMSMDAVLAKGYKLANFCDTSGNPPASKVYRAAKIILAQKNIDGYFGSGSGVASQEQFHSARGLVKAFKEENIDIPVVVRLGGNMEEKAIQILTEYTKDLGVQVECYGKDTPVSYCAERIDKLIKANSAKRIAQSHNSKLKTKKEFLYFFDTITSGKVSFDYELCKECKTKICIKECQRQILKLENDVPVLNITKEEAKKGKCTECLACEVECEMHGNNGGKIELPIEGLDEYLNNK